MAGIRFVGSAGVEPRKCPAIAGTRDHSCAARRRRGYKRWMWGRSWRTMKKQQGYRRQEDNTNQWWAELGGK
jgi:hypothetical protein